MRRPGGFDGGPEPEEPPAPARDRAGDEGFFGGDSEEPSASGGVLRLARWRFGGARSEAASGGDADGDGDGDADRGGAESAEARIDVDAHGDAGDAETRELARTGALVPLRERAGGALARFRRADDEDPVRAAERDLKRAGRARKRQQRQERRRFSAQSRRRRRNWLIVAGAIAALVLFVVAGTVTPLTAVRDIRVTGASLVKAEDVQQALSRFEGVPLALVDDAEVHRALEPFPLIQRYAIERIPPHELVVRIEERVPVIAIEQDGEFRLYDPAGVLLATAGERPAGVPQGEEALSDLDSPAFRSAGAVLRDMPAGLREQVVGASATSAQDLTLTLESGVQVVWGDADQTNRKAVVLTAMVQALEGREVEVIDVSSTEAPVFR